MTQRAGRAEEELTNVTDSDVIMKIRSIVNWIQTTSCCRRIRSSRVLGKLTSDWCQGYSGWKIFQKAELPNIATIKIQSPFNNESKERQITSTYFTIDCTSESESRHTIADED